MAFYIRTGKEKGNDRTYRRAGKTLQKETGDLFQGGIHHQHDEPYLGMVNHGWISDIPAIVQMFIVEESPWMMN